MNNELLYSICLPAYREEENLRLLLPRINEAMKEYRGKYEILILDTTEPLDTTEEACTAHGARYIRRSPSNSFGDAVRSAIREANGQFMIFMDADGSHGPEWIPKLIHESANNDIVIASRYIEGGDTENSPSLIAMSKILNLSYSLILSLKVSDVSNSFKLYRSDLLKGLKLKCQNFDIIEEILFKIKWYKKDVRIKEIPFTFKARMFGRTKRNLLVFIVTYLWTIVRLRFFSW